MCYIQLCQCPIWSQWQSLVDLDHNTDARVSTAEASKWTPSSSDHADIFPILKLTLTPTQLYLSCLKVDYTLGSPWGWIGSSRFRCRELLCYYHRRYSLRHLDLMMVGDINVREDVNGKGFFFRSVFWTLQDACFFCFSVLKESSDCSYPLFRSLSDEDFFPSICAARCLHMLHNLGRLALNKATSFVIDVSDIFTSSIFLHSTAVPRRLEMRKKE
jgi:hypothetical protein